jgi:hypothetical protein
MRDQGTEQWQLDRCGYITSSRLKDAMLVTPEKFKVLRESGTTLKVYPTEAEAIDAIDHSKGQTLGIEPMKPLKGFLDYVDQIVCERLTGVPNNTPDTYQMKWGHDNEPFAIQKYEARTGNIVTSCGFIPANPETGLVKYGSSPDGFVGVEGGAEVKCPVNSTRHLRCFRIGIPEEHHPQLEGQLIATGRDWVDFISYDPRFVGEWEHLGLFVERYFSKPELREKALAGIIRMEAYVSQFIQSLPKAA